ncbi:MAG TPA: flagellar basal body P-ring formation chaperone FlgA [Roseiarcus sp.]|nr:flagellar basal body P-ring formation chaperone FlgA [Roseiarcus sp.]
MTCFAEHPTVMACNGEAIRTIEVGRAGARSKSYFARRGDAGFAAGTILVLAALCGPALAQERGAPTPTAIIYPGDVIRDDMIADNPPGGVRDGGGPFVEDGSLVVGKVARLTLVPGHAIPYAGVSNRKLVANGAEVKLVYSEGGLLIMTEGVALQDGAIGDVVRVRNSDSGVTVSGAVQPDGSVRVGDG